MSSHSLDKVKTAHMAWQEHHDRLRKHEQLLQAALAEYTAGRGPLPLLIMEEVQAMRAECNWFFKELMAALGEKRDQAK